MSLLGTQNDSAFNIHYSVTTLDPSTSESSTVWYDASSYDLYMSKPDLFWQFAGEGYVAKPIPGRDYIVENGTLDYTIQQSGTEITNSKGPYHIALRAKELFKSQNVKIYVAYSDPEKFRVSTKSLINGDDARRYFSSDNNIYKLYKINDNLWFVQYETHESDFDAATGYFTLKFQNYGFAGSKSDYTNIYVSSGTDSWAPGDIIIPESDTVDPPTDANFKDIVYKKTLNNNISLYVRPVIAVTIKFETPDSKDIGDFTVYLVTTTGDFQVGFPSSRPWASGSAEQPSLILKIKRNASFHTIYDWADVYVDYGAHKKWLGKKKVVEEKSFVDDTIILNPNIREMTVTVDLFKIYDHVVVLRYPTTGWPDSATFRLKYNRITVTGGQILTTEPSVVPGTVTYNFADDATSEGGSTEMIINSWSPGWRLIVESVGIKKLLCSDYFKPLEATTDNPITTNVFTYSGISLHGDVQSFPSRTVKLSITGSGTLKVIAYHMKQGQYIWQSSNGWAHNDSKLYYEEARTLSSASTEADGTFVFGPEFTDSTGTKHSVKPVPMLRIMQPGMEWNTTSNTWVLNSGTFDNKISVSINGTSYSETLATGLIIDGTTGDGHAKFLDFTPGAGSADAKNAFKATVDDTATTFTMSANVESSLGEFTITEVQYKPLGSSSLTAATLTAVGDRNKAISERLPGQNYSTGVNIKVRFKSPFPIDSTHTATLSFISGSKNLSRMFTTVSSATAVSGQTDVYEFSVTTTSSDLWEVPIEEGGTEFFSSDETYTMRVHVYDTNISLGADADATFKIQPVIHFGYTSESFSINNAGQTDVDLVYHIRTKTSSRLPDAAQGDPTFNTGVPNTGDTQVSDLTHLTITVSGPDSTTNNRIRYHVTAEDDVVDARTFTSSLKVGTTTIKTASAIAAREMIIQKVFWSDGSTTKQETTNLAAAYLSPVVENNCVEIRLKLRIPGNYNAADASVALNDTRLTHISTTIATHSGTDYQLVVKFSTLADLGGVSDHDDTRWYYTGMPVEFTVSVPRTTAGGGGTLNVTYSVKLGPVITLHNNLPLLGNASDAAFNIQNDNFTIAQLRGHEWFKNAENDIVSTGNGAISSSITTDTGRQFNVMWEYPTGVSLTENPTPAAAHQDTFISGDEPYNYDKQWEVRDTDGTTVLMTVQHAATWTAADNSQHYYQDGGVWRITVVDEDNINDGTLLGRVEVSDGTAAISMMHWYDDKKSKYLNLNCKKEMSVAGIHYMSDPTHSSGHYHGAMKFSEAFMPPVIFTADTSAYSLKVYLKFRDADNMQFSGAQFHINGTYASEIETRVRQNTDNTNIHTTVGTQEYDKPWDICAEARIKSDIGSLSRINELLCFSTEPSHPERARYWTGMKLPFTVMVPPAFSE